MKKRTDDMGTAIPAENDAQRVANFSNNNLSMSSEHPHAVVRYDIRSNVNIDKNSMTKSFKLAWFSTDEGIVKFVTTKMVNAKKRFTPLVTVRRHHIACSVFRV